MDKLTLFNYGKYIREALMAHPKLQAKLKSSFYPVIVPEGTKTPFVVYAKQSGFYDYNKDACTMGHLQVLISPVGTSFDTVEELAGWIDEAMDQHFNKGLSRPRLISSLTAYDDDQELWYSELVYQVECM